MKQIYCNVGSDRLFVISTMMYLIKQIMCATSSRSYCGNLIIFDTKRLERKIKGS